MKFFLAHTNINVTDLERSIAFYADALGLNVVRRKKAEDGAFELAFLTDEAGGYSLELTWLAHHDEAYDLGENESHIAFVTDDIAAARKKHDAMDCVCFDNPAMGIYFIEDPDGYWLEIIPERK